MFAFISNRLLDKLMFFWDKSYVKNLKKFFKLNFFLFDHIWKKKN